MRTIRLPDPSPKDAPPKRLEFGSTDWAADSCLVEWSTLEREWLGVPRPDKAAPVRRAVPRRRPLPLAAMLLALLVAAVIAWALLD